MGKKNDLFTTILLTLHKHSILNDLVLIGSWCLHIYKTFFNNTPEIPLLRTLDIDFLIPDTSQIKSKVNIPEVLKTMGFEINFSPSGYSRFTHDVLDIDFLVPEVGRGRDKPYFIEKLNITPQNLRFLSILYENVITVEFNSIPVKVPEPAAFVIHKFLISSRRKNTKKQLKDVTMATELTEFLLSIQNQKDKFLLVYQSMHSKWQKNVLKVIKEHSKQLFELLSN